jgi:hypothetical protein
MADGLSRSEVVDRIIEVAEVFVRGAAAFGSSEGDCGHDIWATFGEVE